MGWVLLSNCTWGITEEEGGVRNGGREKETKGKTGSLEGKGWGWSKAGPEGAPDTNL